MSQSWSDVVTTGDIPPPTVAPAAVVSSVDKCLYVFGGLTLQEHMGYLTTESTRSLYSLGAIEYLIVLIRVTHILIVL